MYLAVPPLRCVVVDELWRAQPLQGLVRENFPAKSVARLAISDSIWAKCLDKHVCFGTISGAGDERGASRPLTELIQMHA